MSRKIYVWTGERWGTMARRKRPKERGLRGAAQMWVEQLPFAVAVIDREYHVRAWNTAIAELTHCPSEQALGRICGEALGCGKTPDTCNDECGLHACLSHVTTRLPEAWRSVVVLNGGTPIETVALPSEDEGGVLVLREHHPDGTSARAESLANQLAAAGAMQQRLLQLPVDNVKTQGWTLSLDAFNTPSLDVGGDFFRVIPASEHIVYAVIGDVLGKGAAAALVATAASARFEDAIELLDSPRDVLYYVNERLHRSMGDDFFITAIVLRIDLRERTCRMARAGHEAPILLRGGKSRIMAAEANLPLGLSRGQSFRGCSWRFRDGDALLMYTDGLVENVPLTRRLLRRCLRGRRPRCAHDLCSEVRRIMGNDAPPAADDVSVLTLHFGQEKAS